jgi:hypothetical protein
VATTIATDDPQEWARDALPHQPLVEYGDVCPLPSNLAGDLTTDAAVTTTDDECPLVESRPLGGGVMSMIYAPAMTDG